MKREVKRKIKMTSGTKKKKNMPYSSTSPSFYTTTKVHRTMKESTTT